MIFPFEFYKQALILAGAKVIVFDFFNDSFGFWFAKISYGDKTGWIVGHSGSCIYYISPVSKDNLIRFGKRCVENIISQQEAEKVASDSIVFDQDVLGSALQFVKDNRI